MHAGRVHAVSLAYTGFWRVSEGSVGDHRVCCVALYGSPAKEGMVPLDQLRDLDQKGSFCEEKA